MPGIPPGTVPADCRYVLQDVLRLRETCRVQGEHCCQEPARGMHAAPANPGMDEAGVFAAGDLLCPGARAGEQGSGALASVFF